MTSTLPNKEIAHVDVLKICAVIHPCLHFGEVQTVEDFAVGAKRNMTLDEFEPADA